MSPPWDDPDLARYSRKIAAEVGYANRGAAWRTVQRALRERTDDGVLLPRPGT